ncbi:MAG: hypothetical protein AAGD96_07385 [Chloroflexota bacterium]
MKRIILMIMMGILLAACGAEEAPAQTEPEIQASEDVSNVPTRDAGSVSDAVIDTSIETSDDMQQNARRLIRDGRVVVGDQGGDEMESAMAVSLLTSIVEVSEFLNTKPNWQAAAYKHDGYYSLQIRGSETDEFLGFAAVEIENSAVRNYFVARELTSEEFSEGSSFMEGFVLEDPDVQARLGDATAWENEIKYRRMEGIWEVHFTNGDEQIVVPVDNWEERYFIDDVYEVVTDGTADEEQTAAIDVARTANNFDSEIAKWSDVKIYVAQMDDTTYAVSFTAPEREIFYVTVDMISNEIINVTPGFR